MGSAFSFTKLVVSDLAALEQFYTTVFHLVRLRSHCEDRHEFAQDEVMLTAAETPPSQVLILTRYLHKPAPTPGAAWTGFTVTDLDATLQQALSLGASLLVDSHNNPEHGVRAALIADPEGHPIEIIQINH